MKIILLSGCPLNTILQKTTVKTKWHGIEAQALREGKKWRDKTW